MATLILPHLEKTRCLSLTVCGEPVSGGIRLRKRSEPEKEMVARFLTGGRAAYIRAIAAGESRDHLHVDCALAEFFKNDRKRPNATHTKADVLGRIRTWMGIDAEVFVRACFLIPKSDFPESGLVRRMSAKQGGTGLTVQLTGATISVSGSPIKKAGWSLRQGGKVVGVQVEAERRITIADAYLQDSLDWIDAQMSGFFLGGAG